MNDQALQLFETLAPPDVDPRIIRAFEFALTGSLTRRSDGVWIGGSHFGVGKYEIRLSPDSCTCPDFQNGNLCKHVLGLQMRLGYWDGPVQIGGAIIVVLLRAMQAIQTNMHASLTEQIIKLGRSADVGQAQYVTVKQARTITGLSDASIRRAIYARKLPACNKGSRLQPKWLTKKTDLTDWMESDRSESKLPPRPELQALVAHYCPSFDSRG